MVVHGSCSGHPADESAGFFVSYVDEDRAWAEWAAWQVEVVGHRVRIRAWDFGAGSHVVEQTQRALAEARTIAVVSNAYVRSAAVSAEWQAVLAADPSGDHQRLLLVRVEECDLAGLLTQVSSVDIFGLDAAPARERLLNAIRGGRRKPGARPGFPGQRAARAEPVFPGKALVRDADARRLGVHSAILEPGVASGALPTYVDRDVDEAELGLRARLRAAATRGGFVLLLGGSSVGKTRSAVEAVKAIVPDWRLVRPSGPDDAAALAEATRGRTVLWLDELRRYLDGHGGLTAQAMISLLDAAEPVVVVATAWPDWYALRAVPPEPGGQDLYAREREVLGLADVVRVADEFSPAEKARAVRAAANDRQLEAALACDGYGLTQTLAAAPLLVSRWSDAKAGAPYAWAVLTAAIDATRLGVHTPLPADLLCDAAVGYCTSRQQAEAPHGWFDQALSYATRLLHGAASALSPVAAGMGTVAGYRVADYLYQHASQARRSDRVPASTWAALVAHVTDSADCRRLADSAAARMLYGVAAPLYRTAAGAGDAMAACSLAEMLGDHEGLDELCRRADDGDFYAKHKRDRLAVDTAIQHGRLDELRRRAGTGDQYARQWLADVLVDRRDTDELRQRAEEGDLAAARRLADVLVDRRDLDCLRPYVDVSLEDAPRPGTARNDDAGSTLDGRSSYFRVDTSIRYGHSDGVDPRNAAGKRFIAPFIHDRIAKDNYDSYDDETLDVVATTLGDGYAYQLLGKRRIDGTSLGELRQLADSGDARAARRLADLLVERGDLDELHRLVHAGDPHADQRLPDLLARLGRTVEANLLRRFGFDPDGSIATARGNTNRPVDNPRHSRG